MKDSKKIIGLLTILASMGALWTWYEFSGSRADMDAAYNHYYDDAYKNGREKTQCTDERGVMFDCPGQDAVLSRPTDPRNWLTLHLGDMLWSIPGAIGTAVLGALGAKRGARWLDQKFPVKPHEMLHSEMTSHLVRQGFLIVWAILGGIIWFLAPHLFTIGQEAHVHAVVQAAASCDPTMNSMCVAGHTQVVP